MVNVLFYLLSFFGMGGFYACNNRVSAFLVVKQITPNEVHPLCGSVFSVAGVGQGDHAHCIVSGSLGGAYKNTSVFKACHRLAIGRWHPKQSLSASRQVIFWSQFCNQADFLRQRLAHVVEAGDNLPSEGGLSVFTDGVVKFWAPAFF